MAKHLFNADETQYYDLIVAGAGPAGVSAAISAGRLGLKTLLIESTGCAGGTSTSGNLPFWLGTMNGSIPFPQMIAKGLQYKDCPRPRRVVGGVFEDVCKRISLAQGGVGPAVMAQSDKYPGLDRLGCHDEYTFNVETGKRVLDEMLLEAGVTVLYYTQAVEAEMQGEKVVGLWYVNKSGMQYSPCGAVIDATGDADIIARAGFATYKGDKVTGEMTDASLVAHIENIDAGAIEKYLNEGNDPWFRPICAKAKADYPELDLPGHLIIFPMVQDGVFMVNGGTSFKDYDGTSGRSMTDLTLRGRQRARILAEVLFREYMPGAANCRLRTTAAYPGVRETRRIIADYELSENDLLDGKTFPDCIALAGRHFDLQRKAGQVFAEAGKRVKNGVTQIPYRALIPQRSLNIIAAGRCIAAEGQALGPARIMSTCFAVGEAASVAAKLALKADGIFRNVDTDELRSALKAQNAIVD